MDLYNVLASSLLQIASSKQDAVAYLVPDIPRKILRTAWRTFCPKQGQDDILALIDTSFFKNGKEGILFTKNALYIKEPIRKVRCFPYDKITAVIYFQSLSTYSGKSSVSMEFDEYNSEFHLSEQMLNKLNSSLLNEMLQKIIAIYNPDEQGEIQDELRDSENQISHPEQFKPHKYKKDDPQVYSK